MAGLWSGLATFVSNIRQDPNNHLSNAFVEDALKKDKKEGLLLAVKARFFALLVVAVLVIIINPHWPVVYFLGILALFGLIGWAQLRAGKSGVSRLELFWMFCDLALLTIVTIIPNPLDSTVWPPAMQYQYGNFIYFFILLAGASLAYSWRTLVALGTWTTVLWALGLFWIMWQPHTLTEINDKLIASLQSNPLLIPFVDLNNPRLGLRIQEMVVFLIVTFILALNGRRTKALLLRQAETLREHTNLARYFSPTVVEELSKNDQPLKEIRSQQIAVLFVDIIGFTQMAQKMEAKQTIALLREFLGAMENEVFKHNGTLDKYLGDGLMATFGTPFPTNKDASNALACATAMISALDKINEKRIKQGKEKIRAGFGLHYGDVVLGDIGANRMEFAVIGNTVNAAARLETLNRKLACTLTVSDALLTQVEIETAQHTIKKQFKSHPPQAIRGFEQEFKVWTK